MSTGDLIDDDADVGAAVAKILAKGPEALGDRPDRPDPRENRTDREPHEMADDADLDDSSAERGETKATEGAEAGADEEQYLEIPGETEDAEPVQIPLSEAAEQLKQFRQMQGDIATAVIKAESEAHEKQDQITAAMRQTFDQLSLAAATCYQAMQAYLPQPPDPNLRYSDPAAYADQKLFYEEHLQYMERVRATIQQAEQGQKMSIGEEGRVWTQRENDRLARYIPEWKEEPTRNAKRDEILSVLGPKYGFTKEDLDATYDHRAWRALNDLAKLAKVKTEAPQIRKAVQEKAAKIVNGKLPSREQGTGRFVSEDRKQLRETGSIDAAARLFMRSGVTKGL